MRPTPSSSNGIALEASGLPPAFVERLLRAAQPESGPRRRIRIERARACEAVAETVSDAGGFTIRLPGLDSAYGRAGSNFWSQALHEVFHVRYSDFERFRQLDPYRARLANVFEDVRVDRTVKLTVTNADGTNATVYASFTVTVKAYPVQ